jgi:zinc transport system permease protein
MDLAGFWAAREIWQHALLASLLVGGLCGFLGVYVVLRRTVFVSAAVTQLATLGLVTALVIEEALHIETEHAWEQLLAALVFSVAGALGLGTVHSRRRLPAESAVGATYIVAAALVALGQSRLVHETHGIGSILFGNAVAVGAGEVAVIAAVTAACALVHALFAKELVLVSFDNETAAAMGVRTRRWDALLFLTIGAAIPAAARALGALPVFAFLTIPAVGALILGLRLRTAFATATALGALSGAAGYVVSFFLDTPTGATMVVVAALLAAPGLVMGRGR